jgi:Asp/Glu/hydantoin racemase
MPTIAAIYTAEALLGPMKSLFKEIVPSYKLVNIVEDSLIAEVIKSGKVTPEIRRRMFLYFQAAVDSGADLILNTCSSVGDIANTAEDFFSIPVLRIDKPMIEKAVAFSDSIAVIATLNTTMGPTLRLVESIALKNDKKVNIVKGLADGAFDALVGGNPDKHDEIILKTVEKAAKEAEVILLAQGSMARMEKILAEKTGKTVLSSPRLAVEYIKNYFEGK